MADTFLDAHQRETIEAAMARIIPTDDTPGAREAGTIDFLDRYLSGIDYIYALPDGTGFETLTGPRALAWQQRVDHARRVHSSGVVELDKRADDAHGRPFVDLDEGQQDAILRSLERGTTAPTINYGGPEEPALQQTSAESDLDFFGLLVTHTRQGFLADPIYGGNRGQVGWQTIGFPGPKDLAEVHTGQYTTRQYFSDNPTHRSLEESS